MKCRSTITPVKLHLAVYFSRELQYRPTANKKKDKEKAQTGYYGEVLTNDEVVERIETKEREKKEKKEGKRRRKKEEER